jgi:type I restriction enzyme S subunit
MLEGKLRDTVSKQKLGNTMPYIKMAMLTDFPVPVPTLPEQQRIVDILDKAFEGIATAKANTEKNLQNARALFESHLHAVFTPRDGSWPTKALGEVCEFEGGSQPPKSQFIYAAKKNYVRFLQIRDFASEKHVTFIPESEKNRLCRDPDWLI